MSTTTLGAATTYRVDGAGWYSDGTGGTKRWGAYNTQNWVLRYTISVGSVPYKVSSFAWGSGTYTYYGDSNGYNKTPKYVIATASQANNIQVADSSYGMNGLNNATVTARGNCVTQSSGGVAPSITGLNLTLVANTTYYLYIYGSTSVPSYGWSYCTGSCTVTYTIYTACGAPTSVSASPSIVVPSGTITVSWSGATAGTSNTISSYQVYWLISSNGAAPTTSNYTGSKNITSTATSGSTTITLSNATRGYRVVFGVVTRGSAGASYYSGIKTGGSVLINTVPNAPTISPSTTQTLASTNTTGVTITATAGSDVNTSQTRQVNYNTTNSTSGSTKYTNPIVVNNLSAGGSRTYYFWTYDQLEWSSNKSVTIRKNTLPTLSVTPTEVNNYYGSSATLYKIPSSLSIKATKGQYGTNATVSIAIKVGTTEISVESALAVTSGTAKSYTINPQAILANYYSNVDLNYQIIVRYNDGIESAATYTSSSYLIPGAPTTGIVAYDQFDDSNIGTAGYMCKKARIYWPNDTGADTVGVTVTGSSSGALGATLVDTDTDGNDRYADIQLTQNPASNEVVTFNISLSKGTRLTKTLSKQLTTIRIPTFGVVSSTSQTVYPFESNVKLFKTIVWPFDNCESVSAASADGQYCFNISQLKFCIATSTSSTNIKEVAVCSSSVDTPIKRDIDNLQAAFYVVGSSDGIVSFNKTTDRQYLGLSATDPTYTGTPSVVGYFTLTNKYGETFVSQTASFTLDFMSAPQITGDFVVAPFYNDSKQVYVQEGLIPKASYTFSYKTEGNYTFNIAQASSPTVLSDTDKAALTWTNIYSNTDTNARVLVNGEQSHQIVVTNEDLNTSYTEVSSTNYRYYRLTISIGSLSHVVYSDEVKVIKHIAPTIKFTGFSADGDSAAVSTTPYEYTITGLYVSDSGAAKTDGAVTIANVSPTGAIYDGTDIIAPWNNTVIPASITGTATNYTWSSHGEEPWVRAIRYIQVTTTVTNQVISGTVYSHTKTFNLAQTGLFISAPTVAYRKNYLGINTKAPVSTATIDIIMNTGRDYIRIVGANNTLLIDADAGAIALFSSNSAASLSDASLVHIIDLANGVIN